MIAVPTGQVAFEHLPLCALVSCIVLYSYIDYIAMDNSSSVDYFSFQIGDG